eukprot:jgi/Bigna1/68305/fgenesh1_pg.5_\
MAAHEELKGIKLRKEVVAIEKDVIAMRRHFHMYPELSLKEQKTAQYIAEKLKDFGLEVTTNVGGHGVVGVLRGGVKGGARTIAIRADMDGLPIQEQVEADYKSKNNGVMHACGHDGHMAILLGAVQVVAPWKKKIKGNIKFIFQPAEEGFGGAKSMIDDGVLTSAPKVDEIYGLHLWNYQEVGTVGARIGPIMAASDRFNVEVRGTADAIVASAQLISGLHTIVPRNISPLDPAVLTVGTVNGGYASNVIADKVDISGTVRTFESEVQDTIITRMCQLCKGLGTAYDVKASLDYRKGYPATKNTSKPHLDILVKAAKAVVEEDRIIEPRQVPGCFYFLGSAIDMKEIRPHHKSVFDIDERCLAIGVSIWVELIEQELVLSAGSSLCTPCSE